VKRRQATNNAATQSDTTNHNSILTMSALTLLTETAEAEESRSLKLKTDMLLVEVWARNSLYQFAPFIPHANSLDCKSDFYKIFIMEYGREIAGTMSNKVLSRTTAENPYPESERSVHLKELWELSRNRIRHALSQKRTAVMNAMQKLYLGKYRKGGCKCVTCLRFVLCPKKYANRCLLAY
jgi:hypothetical protein